MHHSSSSASYGNNNNQSEKPETATSTETATALTTDMTDHGPAPQPKLSRATQKPHVRKNRRQSSMERRRARYARLDAQEERTIFIRILFSLRMTVFVVILRNEQYYYKSVFC